MAYVIAGSSNEPTTLIIVNGFTDSVETVVSGVTGDFNIEDYTGGEKIVISRNNGGRLKCYGGVYYSGERGLFFGGQDINRDFLVSMDYITISTLANAKGFGSLVNGSTANVGASNGNKGKGVTAGGKLSSGGRINMVDYVTIASLSDFTNFGNLSNDVSHSSATSNGTNNRCIIAGGVDISGIINNIEYINISVGGESLDFGDISTFVRSSSSNSNHTNDRGLISGGDNSEGYLNIIDYITISTTGAASDFGDLTANRTTIGATDSGENDRGVFGGGYDGSNLNIIDYITISTTGNAVDFGDLTINNRRSQATSNSINNRGVFAGGTTDISESVSDIYYIDISSLSNSSSFASLTIERRSGASTSDA